jgi:hypothetical protein
MDFADPLCMSKELRKLMMIARKLPVCSPVNLCWMDGLIVLWLIDSISLLPFPLNPIKFQSVGSAPKKNYSTEPHFTSLLHDNTISGVI